VHFRKIFVGFCLYLEVSHWILSIFGSSSYNFVHGILFIFGISSWQSIHVSISSFHFFSTKYVFLQHAYWLIASIARGSSENAQNPMIDFE
jgi:hypothetical protein